MPSSRLTTAHALRRAALLSSALGVCLLSTDVPGAPLAAQPATASATLPLDRVLQLFRENEQRNDTVPPPAPPVACVVHQLQIEARLLDDAVAGKARFSVAVVVLTENKWASVALLTVSGDTRIAHCLHCRTPP